MKNKIFENSINDIKIENYLTKTLNCVLTIYIHTNLILQPKLNVNDGQVKKNKYYQPYFKNNNLQDLIKFYEEHDESHKFFGQISKEMDLPYAQVWKHFNCVILKRFKTPINSECKDKIIRLAKEYTLQQPQLDFEAERQIVIKKILNEIKGCDKYNKCNFHQQDILRIAREQIKQTQMDIMQRKITVDYSTSSQVQQNLGFIEAQKQYHNAITQEAQKQLQQKKIQKIRDVPNFVEVWNLIKLLRYDLQHPALQLTAQEKDIIRQEIKQILDQIL